MMASGWGNKAQTEVYVDRNVSLAESFQSLWRIPLVQPPKAAIFLFPCALVSYCVQRGLPVLLSAPKRSVMASANKLER